ncbi:pentapeptide repeat protein [Enterococcus phoeniculicola]|uniref:Pentapeptide repeat protein n=1 Tax=Enterococcus phoeniculicola ATCC BAA-412 TaxID=1158610 RepID=R3WSE7_9ENTE|nr:pentapeptide repeat-containing protein [Enterococcus phoeniculicola]EOL44750.1 pentapeptide repeat protein [Enterococcus phoeniculicola ATCC BAA-412]EOT75039.1 pentapeptide repeat protein [Enterococcus phoeniculicola ATCC BAA-412]OJG72926.1 pentapeptide repeat protein [Enterococcus phoeniculicola]
MKKTTPAAPILPALTNSDIYLEDEAIFQGIHAADLDLSYDTCSNLVIREAHLQRLVMQRTQLERFECSNVIFENCDLSNLEWIAGSFQQVLFKQCKLTGTNFAESYLRDCQFDNCLATLSSFSNTNLKTVTFSNCELTDSEFVEVTWKQLVLEENQLTGSSWFHTKLAHLNLSTNTFDSIALSQEWMKGLIVNQEQAIVIAMGLGLVIED